MSLLPSTPDPRANEKREVLFVGGAALAIGTLCTSVFFSASTPSQALLWLGLGVGLYGLIYLCIGFFAAPEVCRKALRYVPIPF